MGYHLTLVRTAIIQKLTNNKCQRRCGEKGRLLHCWWEWQLVQSLWKKELKIELRSNNPTLGHMPEQDSLQHNLK